MNYRVFGALISLFCIGVLIPKNMSGKLNCSHLHSEAKSEIRNIVLAGKPYSFYFALNTPSAPALRNQYGINHS